jgi:hypothetical protein
MLAELTRTLPLLFAVPFAAPPAWSWGITPSHPQLTRIALDQFDRDRVFSRYLNEEFGFHDGVSERIRLRLRAYAESAAVADDIEPKLGVSRLSRSFSLADWPPFSSAPDYIDSAIASGETVEVKKLFRIGVWAEDNPNPRSKHHFHDPERAHEPPADNHGLDNAEGSAYSAFTTSLAEAVTAVLRGDFRHPLRSITGLLLSPLDATLGTDADVGLFSLRGRSAVDRALNTPRESPLEESSPSERYPTNYFALPDAERYLYRGITAQTPEEREHHLTLHLLAVAHVIHLLEDMSSPAHTRNDFLFDHLHLLSNIEKKGDEVLKDGESGLGSFLAQPLASLDASGFDASDFWDQGLFDDPSGRGLAELVHNRFFSESSLADSDEGGYALPRVVSCQALGDADGETTVVELPERDLLSGEEISPPAGTALPRFLSTPVVPRLARCGFHSLARLGATVLRRESTGLTVLDESVQRDYIERLFPMLIDYVVKFMEFYFRPRIDVVPTGNDQFRLVNHSGLTITADVSEIRAVYDDVAGGRSEAIVPCGVASGSFTLADGEFLNCDLAGSVRVGAALAPRSRGDFTLVIRGQVGQRGSVVTPSDPWESSDYVTMHKRVLGWRILYANNSFPTPNPGAEVPDTDEARRVDIWQVSFDLGAALAGTPVSYDRNLTEPLRRLLPEAVRDRIDFHRPRVDGSGTTIVAATDLALELGETSLSPDADRPDAVLPLLTEHHLIDLGGPIPLRRLAPPVGVLPAASYGGGAVWNEGPGSLDVLFSATQGATSYDPLSGFVEATSTTPGTLISWDPSGTWLPLPSGGIFVSAAQGDTLVGHDGGKPNRTFLASAASRKIQRIVDFDASRVVACNATDPSDPCSQSQHYHTLDARLSPDGARAAFVAYDTVDEHPELLINVRHRGDIWVAPTADGPLQPLVVNDGNAEFPAYSRDGEWIAFADHADRQIYVVPSSGGTPLVVTLAAPLDPSQSPAENPNVSRTQLEWMPTLELPE